jgi:hypothetical protein
MQPTLPNALYFQGAHRINLPRLFFSLLQAEINYQFLGTMPLHQGSGESTSEGEIICLQLTTEDYQKFQQVFVQRRFVAVNDGCDRCFWDSRTGLTVHIVLVDPERSASSAATASNAESKSLFSWIQQSPIPNCMIYN